MCLALFYFTPNILAGVFTFRLCSGKIVKQRTDESSSAVPGFWYLVTDPLRYLAIQEISRIYVFPLSLTLTNL